MRLIWEEKFEEKLRKKNKEDGLKIKVSEEKQAEEYSHFHTGAMVTLLSRPWDFLGARYFFAKITKDKISV